MRAAHAGERLAGRGCMRPCKMLRRVAGMLLGRVGLCRANVGSGCCSLCQRCGCDGRRD